MQLLNGLNPAQQQAVTSSSRVIQCLAGAGSGKTTVLTRRIANLNTNHRIGTSNMLALTFTRLAGMEMKERVMKLVGEQEGKKLFCNTFHAFAAMVLKEWGHKLGIEKNFTIYDQQDREAILQRIIQDQNIRTTLKKVFDRFVTCTDVSIEKARFPEECRALIEYGYRLRQNNAIDIDRMINLVNMLWRSHTEALQYYRRMYTHVFVDEFQDSSDDQMEMIRLLDPEYLFVVGDDFQAIYGWRGARVQYIIDFPKAYPGCEVIKLEDNYRSTDLIVSAANALIAHNTKQTQKRLIAHKSGVQIDMITLHDPKDEAAYIATEIEKGVTKGMNYKSFAILGRTNGLINTIQSFLEKTGIPVQRIGNSDDVFKLNHIKNMLAWMELLINPKDSMALKRSLRYPKHYATDLQIQELEMEALANESSLLTVVEARSSFIPGFRLFEEDLTKVRYQINQNEAYRASEWMRILNDALGIGAGHRANGLVNREQDVERAISYMESWERTKETLGEDRTVSGFLKWLKYRDLQEKLTEEKKAVKLMTIHASKGLEFDSVFIAGLNQGVFPSKRTSDFDEERRLMYVAITRARERLSLSSVEFMPDWNGELQPAYPSQFLRESLDVDSHLYNGSLLLDEGEIPF
ncbi:ATP-dependent helicase [Paenibacillus elgii]|uniref:ATP-dependent helicase n=1 Tax=Paenibacillus elgii TaxID=189691 RepID=UPI0013D15F88|nr:ATP-dependent helicase [Paenibacillus elgii]